MGAQFDIVGFAPVSPRKWMNLLPADGARCDSVGAALIGSSQEFYGHHTFSELMNPTLPDMIGIGIWGPVIIVAWSGMPETAFNWEALDATGLQRFRVGSYPASSGAEIDWTAADGSLLRRVEVSNGEVVADEGTDWLVDEHADTDRSLWVDTGTRLSQKVINELIREAGEDAITVYDRRRYIPVTDEKIWHTARIGRRHNGRLWVAIDQRGPVNTLFNPLSRDLRRSDPEELAWQMLDAWFAIDDEVMHFRCYGWPDQPESLGIDRLLRRAVERRATLLDALTRLVPERDPVDVVADQLDVSTDDAQLVLMQDLSTLFPYKIKPNQALRELRSDG